MADIGGSEEILPYSAAWLRERGASYDPLTGRPVPQPAVPMPRLVDKHDVAQPLASDKHTPPLVEPDTPVIAAPSPSATAAMLPQPIPTQETSANAYSQQAARRNRKPSRLPIIMGLIIVLLAVFAAEHYLVPMFSKPKKLVSSSTTVSQVGAIAPIPATVIPPRPSVSSVPPSVPAREASTHTPTPAVTAPSTRQAPALLPVPKAEEQVPAPVQAPSVIQSPPSSSVQVGPHSVTEPRHESKAQFEQQHMQQLLSPLG